MILYIFIPYIYIIVHLLQNVKGYFEKFFTVVKMGKIQKLGKTNIFKSFNSWESQKRNSQRTKPERARGWVAVIFQTLRETHSREGHTPVVIYII